MSRIEDTCQEKEQFSRIGHVRPPSPSLTSDGPSKDANNLLAVMAAMERDVNNVAAKLNDVADRMWGVRGHPVDPAGKEGNQVNGCSMARLEVMISTLGQTVGRLHDAAERFERLA